MERTLPDGPLIFLSHASRDKPRIGHIVDDLVANGYRIFIDHPEAIDARFTPTFCAANGIETLWSSTGETNWSDRLKRALSDCDCVLVVVSEALTQDGLRVEDADRLSPAENTGHRVEWKAEIMWGEALRKLVFAKIGSFDSGVLPSYVRLIDAIDVSPGLPPATLANNLAILRSERIAPAVGNGLKSTRMDQFRAVLDLLPLCVGRREQRRALIYACRHLAESGATAPIVLASPDNELPSRFFDAVSLVEDGSGSGDQINVKHIELPLLRGEAFQREFALSLIEEFFKGSYGTSLASLADHLRGGHPTIIVSIVTVGTTPASLPLAEWIAFWKKFAQDCPRTPVIPVLSVLLGPAAPGWPDFPPLPKLDRASYKRNRALCEWLGAEAASAGASPAFVFPSIMKPIALAQALGWARDIRSDVLANAQRDALEATISTDLYGNRPERESGINHAVFTDKLRTWFQTLRSAA